MSCWQLLHTRSKFSSKDGNYWLEPVNHLLMLSLFRAWQHRNAPVDRMAAAEVWVALVLWVNCEGCAAFVLILGFWLLQKGSEHATNAPFLLPFCSIQDTLESWAKIIETYVSLDVVGKTNTLLVFVNCYVSIIHVSNYAITVIPEWSRQMIAWSMMRLDLPTDLIDLSSWHMLVPPGFNINTSLCYIFFLPMSAASIVQNWQG